MRYKKLMVLLLTSLLILFVFKPIVLAANTADTGTSDVTIEFTAAETGSLTLDYVVPSFVFAGQEVSGNDETYQSTTPGPYIQITDRRGTGAGWHVIAQASNFTTGTEQSSLPGAVITLNNGTVDGNIYSSEPVPAKPVVLNAGGDASEVINAGENAGMGTWKNLWDNVTLTIQAGSATLGTHTATITWTLQDAPR